VRVSGGSTIEQDGFSHFDAGGRPAGTATHHMIGSAGAGQPVAGRSRIGFAAFRLLQVAGRIGCLDRIDFLLIPDADTLDDSFALHGAGASSCPFGLRLASV